MEIKNYEQKILNLLEIEPKTSYELAALLNIGFSTVYQHLKVMLEKKLVKTVKSNRKTLWFKNVEA